MSDHRFSESAEEALETLYITSVEDDEPSIAANTIDASIIEELHSSGSVLIESDRIALSGSGIDAGKSVVRRHRLAERLLADVLGSGESAMHEQACKFEHVLSDGLADQICTLLGHPKICPHGRPIPAGGCCHRNETAAEAVIVPLSRMKKKGKGSVAYINATEPDTLNKLMAMGILPGAAIELIQSFPSYVFQAGQSQFAVDRDIAESIFIRTVG